MELIKEKINQKQSNTERNENSLSSNISNKNSKQNSCYETFNIKEIRKDMNDNGIMNSNIHLMTDLNDNNITFQENNNESLKSSNNEEMVMNQSYNYNPKCSSKNSSDKKNYSIEENLLYLPQQENNNNFNFQNNNNFQNDSEKKLFNPGLFKDLSTKKSTRSSISDDENTKEIKNYNENLNNKERGSLVNIINEYYENNEKELSENTQDDEMITSNIAKEKNEYYDNSFTSNDNINFSGEKSMNSEKMNLGKEEISNLLKDDNQYKNSIKELQINKEKTHSKNNNKKEKQLKSKNRFNKNSNVIKEKDKNNIQKRDINKYSTNVQKNIKLNQQNERKITNENEIFQGNYKIYKDYEKYILNNNDEFIDLGEEKDIFGKYVDKIIENSYHIYTNRQCPSCANLLTKGKSCKECPKYHHLIKAGKIKNEK